MILLFFDDFANDAYAVCSLRQLCTPKMVVAFVSFPVEEVGFVRRASAFHRKAHVSNTRTTIKKSSIGYTSS